MAPVSKPRIPPRKANLTQAPAFVATPTQVLYQVPSRFRRSPS
jgi:hypothetical protein